MVQAAPSPAGSGQAPGTLRASSVDPHRCGSPRIRRRARAQQQQQQQPPERSLERARGGGLPRGGGGVRGGTAAEGAREPGVVRVLPPRGPPPCDRQRRQDRQAVADRRRVRPRAPGPQGVGLLPGLLPHGRHALLRVLRWHSSLVGPRNWVVHSSDISLRRQFPRRAVPARGRGADRGGDERARGAAVQGGRRGVRQDAGGAHQGRHMHGVPAR
mmetsp:Transcript_6697/g.16415  ORF Transcript_6697/g.16415 Transcript_6697/m.16415 type:complete len:215 (+) Transcript_6697:446-1090(+)